MDSIQEPLLSAQEMAGMLQTTVRTLRRDVRKGLIPVIKMGRRVRFHAPSVLAAIRGNDVKDAG